jgi:ABC-type nitrate/sulfonate/bicarbonate transport system permease component
VRAEPRWLRWLVPALSLAAGISLWEFLGSRTSAAFLSTFSATMSRLAGLVRSGEFTEALGQSLSLFAAGFALAIIVAVPFGLLLARMRLLRVALEPYIMALYATPMAALAPFILSMMGFGFAPKVVVVYLFAVFPILYNTIEGARSVRPDLIEVARSFRSSEARLWRDVMIPYTLPFALTGMRQGIGRGLVGMVVAEFFLSASGIGRLIIVSERDFDTAGVLAAIIVISVLGALLMGLGRLLENRFSAWRGIGR